MVCESHLVDFQWPEDYFPEAEDCGLRLATSLSSILNLPSGRVTHRDWTSRGGFLDFQDLESARWVAASVKPVTLQCSKGEVGAGAATAVANYGIPVQRRVIRRDHVVEDCTLQVIREGLGGDIRTRTLDLSLPGASRDARDAAEEEDDDGVLGSS